MRKFTETELVASICLDSLFEFTKEFWPEASAEKPVWNWHIKELCDEVQVVCERVFAGEPSDYDLVVNQPPGTTKSIVMSVMTDAWAKARMPSFKFLGASYAHSLAQFLSLKTRDVVGSQKYQLCFPQVQVRTDQDAKAEWITTKGGVRFAVGARGAVIGRHFHLICLPWESSVVTDLGELPIGYIVDNEIKVHTMSYDHKSGSLRWQPVEAYEVSDGRPLCKVYFTDGSDMELTHEHPIFVHGEGYIPAERLEPGDQVYQQPDMRVMRGAVSATRLEAEEAAEVIEEQESLLFSALWQGSQMGTQEALQGLWSDYNPLWQSTSVLQCGLPCQTLPGSRQSQVGQESEDQVPPVRNLFFPKKNNRPASQVLLQSLCRCSPLGPDAGHWQFKLHARQVLMALLAGVYKTPESHTPAGRSLLFFVQENGDGVRTEAISSPYRLRQEQQQECKPGRALPILPWRYARQVHWPSALGKKVVSHVELAVRIPSKVYNLRVAKDQNYFAEGILVHNCIDDPIDPQNVVSEVELKEVNRWIRETLPERKVDKALTPTILVAQRLAQDDPPGEMLDSGQRVRHICLPAELTDDHNVQPPEWAEYYIDGLLDPVRLPRSVLEAAKMRGSYFYSGQYLQNPVPLGGGMFLTSKINIEAMPPLKFKRVVRFWDKAASKKKGNYSVGLKMGLDELDEIWILDVKREQLNSAAREDLILKTARADGKNVIIGLEQEGGSGGKESVEGTVKRLSAEGFRTRVDRPVGEKELRADPFSQRVNIGNVNMRKGPWNDAYLDELRFFPFGRYDDQVDASSGAFTVLFKSRFKIGALGRKNNKQRIS